jgi:hypothetical protein
MDTVDEVVTVDVSITNVASVEPDGMLMVEGTLATSVLLLESAMEAPPLGAAADNRTVAVGRAWPSTVEALTEIDDSAAAGGGVVTGAGPGAELGADTLACGLTLGEGDGDVGVPPAQPNAASNPRPMNHPVSDG